MTQSKAADVGKSAAERAGEVSGVVGEQARQVASETRVQARNLLEEGVDQVREQARDGQRKLAEGLRSVAGQLRRMSDRNDDSGVAADVMRQATDRTEQVASWLEAREPGDLVDEVRRFARRRPGVFLAGAVVAGVLAGRLTRNVVASSQDKGPDEQRPESDWRAENPVATTDYPDFPQTAPATSGYPQEPAPGAVVQPATPGSGPIR